MNLFKRTAALVAVPLLLGTAGCGKSLSDATITGRVKMAIASEPGLQGTKVNVKTDQKVVLISGTVKSRTERAMLIATTRKVEGVKAVKTDLVVQEEQKQVVAARRTAAEPRKKPQPRGTQLRSTPPGPGVPPER